MSKKNDFAVLEEIYNNVAPHWSAVLISLQLHDLSLFQKTLQIRDQFFLYMDPVRMTIILTRSCIGMDRNFVCLWRRHNRRSQVIDLSLSALIS
jgi:hypothetical protein